MADQIIRCPSCKQDIPLTEAISRQVRETVLRELEGSARKKEEEFQQKAQALARREQDLEAAKKGVEEQIALKLKVEAAKLEKEAQRKAQELSATEMKDLRNQIDEKSKKLDEARNAELELRKQQRKLEEDKKNFELDLSRKLDEERAAIREQVQRSFDDEHRIKEEAKEKQIADMRRQIDDLKRKAEQGSQLAQGELLELNLETILRTNFPYDQIEPVPKGINGADVLQKVFTANGQCCGTIIWESKRTKAWSDGWIAKLKEDQRAVKAEIAALMSSVVPKEIANIGNISGVWVTNTISVVGLAMALRANLIEVAAMKLSNVGKQEKMDVLYAYLSGTEFRQRVEAIVEHFGQMQQDLEKEKRAMMLLWSKRQKQIEQVIHNTAGMYGDMQAIMGASLPQIKSLNLNPEPDVLQLEADEPK